MLALLVNILNLVGASSATSVTGFSKILDSNQLKESNLELVIHDLLKSALDEGKQPIFALADIENEQTTLNMFQAVTESYKVPLVTLTTPYKPPNGEKLH